MPESIEVAPNGMTDPAADAAPVRILLVDDEARNLDVLESLLHSPEYELVRALTAEKALILLLDGEFAAIVLDIQMPGMSGIELANLIKQRKRTRHIPIIFLTAYCQTDDDVLQGYGSGAVDFLTKPINPQILRSKIAIFVELFRKTKALTASNDALEVEIAQRLKAEEALRRSNDELEARVAARTVDLRRANEELSVREAALSASEIQAKAAAHAKDEFLAALSHELRTPLNPVLLLAGYSADNPALPPAIRADFEMIRRNIELEARLIDDLLDLTRITRGLLRLELRLADANAIVRDAVAIVRPDADAKGLEVSLEFGAAGHTIRGDAVRLQQVVWNLMKNAVKFTPAGGKITLRTRASLESDEWLFSIADTGIGLTPEELGRVFEAFSQGDHARRPGSHRFGGLGLGLAISRRLVELHAGRIEARSAGRDQGSVFTVALPLAREPALPASLEREGADFAGQSAPARPRAVGPATASGRRSRILLVEDHAATRATLTHLLGCREYEVTAAESVAEARAAAARESFDLLISDIGLPDGSGCDLLQILRTTQPHLPGIALSGYGMDDDLARSRLAGFAEHLIKPVALDALDTAIVTSLGADGGKGDRGV